VIVVFGAFDFFLLMLPIQNLKKLWSFFEQKFHTKSTSNIELWNIMN
jgi:hypothetical protein